MSLEVHAMLLTLYLYLERHAKCCLVACKDLTIMKGANADCHLMPMMHAVITAGCTPYTAITFL